jgi:hypothetical protein
MIYRFVWRRTDGAMNRWVTKDIRERSLGEAVLAFHSHIQRRLKLAPTAYEVDHPVLERRVGQDEVTRHSLTTVECPFQVHWDNQTWPAGHFPDAATFRP